MTHLTERFSAERFIYQNGGVSEEEVKRAGPPQPTEETKRMRLKSAEDTFSELEELFKLSKEGSWGQRMMRLEELFKEVGWKPNLKNIRGEG